MKNDINNTMFTYILWQFLTLETFVLGALCCPCVPEHPQKQFCKSEFVLKVKIHTAFNATYYQFYTVEIKKVFKGDDRELRLIENRDVLLNNRGEIVLIYSSCGDPSINIGKEYVIFGHIKFGRILVSPTVCLGSMTWRWMSRFVQRAYEADYYKDNCDCAPEISYDSNDTFRDNYCKLGEAYMRRSGEKCKWTNTASFRRCLNYWLPGIS